MAFPTFVIGPAATVAGWIRDQHQSRRKVRLTVHHAYAVEGFARSASVVLEPEPGAGNYYVTVTNASRDRDIVVTHVWLDTTPSVQVVDAALPVRLKHSAQWETIVPAAAIPEGTTDVEWRARCQISPDDKVIKSRPRRNVPPVGTVPRG